MNKQELISIIRTEVLLAKSSPERKGYIAGLEMAINIIEGFSNEPQKPVVPQFVADWYEIHKDSFEPDLFACIRDILSDRCVANISEFEHWILGQKESITTLINMHQFGYKVEKEKRYTVRIKNIQSGTAFLKYDLVIEKWYFGIFQNSTSTRLYHTKEELEKGGFEWAFSCDGVEVEEVQDDSKI